MLTGAYLCERDTDWTRGLRPNVFVGLWVAIERLVMPVSSERIAISSQKFDRFYRSLGVA